MSNPIATEASPEIAAYGRDLRPPDVEEAPRSGAGPPPSASPMRTGTNTSSTAAYAAVTSLPTITP